jgi:hypothetical protein
LRRGDARETVTVLARLILSMPDTIEHTILVVANE